MWHVERWKCVRWVAKDPKVPKGSQVSFSGGWSEAFSTKEGYKECNLHLGDRKREEGESYNEGLVTLPNCSVGLLGGWGEDCLQKPLNSSLHCRDVQSGVCWHKR